MAGFPHHRGAWIIVLVNAVAEAHQAGIVLLGLNLADIFLDVVLVADLGQHLEDGLVGATMGRTPQARNTGRDAGERVGAR